LTSELIKKKIALHGTPRIETTSRFRLIALIYAILDNQHK